MDGTPQAISPARQTLLGADAQAWPVHLTWQLPGESAPAEHTVWLTVVTGPAGPRLAGTIDGPSTDHDPQPLWWLRPITTATADGVTVVVGPGQSAGRWLARVRTSLAGMRAHLPPTLGTGWSGRVVVEVPATVADLGTVLGDASGAYDRVAAVTRPEGPTVTSVVRVVVNPEAGGSADLGLTLTHELVHVATDSTASPAPLWAVEGLAEYVAYAAHPDARAGTERQVAAALAADGLPRSFPADAAFGAGAADATVAYGEAWLACRSVADSRSAADLGRFYARLDRGDPVDVAARTALGESEGRLLADWRTALGRLPKPAG